VVLIVALWPSGTRNPRVVEPVPSTVSSGEPTGPVVEGGDETVICTVIYTSSNGDTTETVMEVRAGSTVQITTQLGDGEYRCELECEDLLGDAQLSDASDIVVGDL